MGTVSQDAINQFKALMDQGSVLISFYLFTFLKTLLNFTVFNCAYSFQNVMAVEEPLKRAYQVCIFLLFIYVST